MLLGSTRHLGGSQEAVGEIWNGIYCEHSQVNFTGAFEALFRT